MHNITFTLFAIAFAMLCVKTFKEMRLAWKRTDHTPNRIPILLGVIFCSICFTLPDFIIHSWTKVIISVIGVVIFTLINAPYYIALLVSRFEPKR
jgi:hypothetical protein